MSIQKYSKPFLSSLFSTESNFLIARLILASGICHVFEGDLLGIRSPCVREYCGGAGTAGSIRKKKGQRCGQGRSITNKTKTNQEPSSPSLFVVINEYQCKTKRRYRTKTKTSMTCLPILRVLISRTAAIALLNTCVRLNRRNPRRRPQPPDVRTTTCSKQPSTASSHPQQAAIDIRRSYPITIYDSFMRV